MAGIKDVAALAGVSPATVSRVMNGTAKVDPEKKEEEKAAQAAGQTGETAEVNAAGGDAGAAEGDAGTAQ